jgi:hypothetical protein
MRILVTGLLGGLLNFFAIRNKPVIGKQVHIDIRIICNMGRVRYVTHDMKDFMCLEISLGT